MDKLFGRPKTMKEQVRENDRALRKTERELQRDRNALERQEKQLELEIKQAAKRGDKQTATILAKQLVNLRKQKTRSHAASSKITSVGMQAKGMASQMKMAEAMKDTTKVMGNMNRMMKPEDVMKNMQAFERESAKLEMSEEVMNDTLDDILNESGDEEEQDAIVNQVLDEIGIEISGKIAGAPQAAKGAVGGSETEKGLSDADIEKQLEMLKM